MTKDNVSRLGPRVLKKRSSEMLVEISEGHDLCYNPPDTRCLVMKVLSEPAQSLTLNGIGEGRTL